MKPTTLSLEHLLNGLSDEEKQKFYSIGKVKEYEANEHILMPGDTCSKIWFLNHGALRMYKMVNGKDQTLHLFNSSRFFTDFVSFKDKTPTTYSFQCLTPSSIMEFDIEKFYELPKHSINFEMFGRKLLEIILYEETSRLDDLLFNDATQRYDNLLFKNPTLFQTISQKYIASYLNITPETLSRIRKKKK